MNKYYLVEELKKVLRIFVFTFIGIFVILSLGIITGLFDYNEMFNLKEESPSLDSPVLSVQNQEYIDKPDSVEISKIGVIAPIIIPKTNLEEDILKSLKDGVAFYPDSVLPGEKGETIILGHSAPAGWPKINYDWVFTRLNELVENDEIIVYFNNQEYKYRVKRNIILQSGQDVPQLLTNSGNMLSLISCWPPGVDHKRIVVQAENY